MNPTNPIDSAYDCDAIQELIPDYAFGLADQADIWLVETNLASCPEAAAQLADFRKIQDDLRASVPQIAPSAELGERLMAAIATPSTPSIIQRAPFRWAWLAAAMVIVALAGTNLYWLSRVNDLSQQQAALISRLAETSSPADSAFVVNATDELRWVHLPAAQHNADANAFLMWNGQSENGLLYVKGFPKLEVGKTYELWLRRGSEVVSAGTLQLDETGQGALLFHIDKPIDRYSWAGITVQPDIDGTAPSGITVVGGKLQS